MNQKTKNILTWVLTGLVGLLFVGSATAKLMGSGAEAEKMAAAMGGLQTLKAIGILELCLVVLWIIPRTAFIGALMLMCYMGGAIAVHTTTGQPVMGPIVIESMIWLVSFLRFPQFWAMVKGN